MFVLEAVENLLREGRSNAEIATLLAVLLRRSRGTHGASGIAAA